MSGTRTDKRAGKAAQTSDVARSIIDAERKATESKTARLRNLRLAREEADAGAEPAKVSSKAAKKPVRAKTAAK